MGALIQLCRRGGRDLGVSDAYRPRDLDAEVVVLRGLLQQVRGALLDVQRETGAELARLHSADHARARQGRGVWTHL
ncbi:hypothetical protein [Nonomuraea sp. NPDC049709]|uniref:hypothetical protein n=1 Tax=Nonomuraea sp. NPDC049709 TaxID=3154736 RepID=UPI00344A618D